MATKKKKTSPAPKPSSAARKEQRPAGDYRKSYVRLRTVLDAMEVGALRFYLEGETTEERERRAQELEGMIMPMLARFKQGLIQDCPPGLINCGGCCVPYPCLD